MGIAKDLKQMFKNTDASFQFERIEWHEAVIMTQWMD